MSNDLKAEKRQAFMSFLESAPSKPQLEDKKNNSDQEEVQFQEYEETSNSCSICLKEGNLEKKFKTCQFCYCVVCPDHLRKRRRKQNKWERICDTCQDKILYESYMKLQIKAEEALSVEEEIIMMKHKNAGDLYYSKKIKRRQVGLKTNEIIQSHQEKMSKLKSLELKQQHTRKKIQSDQQLCRQMDQYINRMEKLIKQNFSEDYDILTEEDMKMGKELAQIEKKIKQIKQKIEKGEKQFEVAYEEWQRKQFKKQATSKTKSKGKYDKQQCKLF